MRTQNLSPQMGKKKRKIAIIISIILFLIAIAIVIITSQIKYRPPKFDENALTGVPSPDESFLYDTVKSDFGYSFGIAANLYQQEDRSCKIFLTNPKKSNVYLMCEIADQSTDEVLYESGVIKPGEYIEAVQSVSKFANEAKKVSVKVHAFEKDSWVSAGTTELDMMLQPW